MRSPLGRLVVQTEAPQRLVEAREQVRARAPLDVRARPHPVARLARDHQLVAVGGEVRREQPAEGRLGEAGLTATQSYWDRTPYVEVDDATGVVAYVEHHRTLGDWVRLLAGHGFVLSDVVEPEWPEHHD